MKILFIGDEIQEKRDIRNFNGVWSYYLLKEMRNLGVEFGTSPMLSMGRETKEQMIAHYKTLDIEQYDHVVALGLRYFDYIYRECGEILRHRVRGALAQLYDGSLLDRPPVDLTLTFRNDDHLWPIGSPNSRYERHTQHNKYIGWAADSEALTPCQDPDELRILVDHTGFNIKDLDLSLHIMTNIREFVRSGIWMSKFKSVRVRRLIDQSVEECDLENICIQPYQRRAIPYIDACAEYSKAHLFFVTHKESVGLTVLESAMSGALPIVPKGYIPQDRLDTVRHLIFENNIPWKDVINHINVEASRHKALANSWSAVAGNFLFHLNNFSPKY